MHYICQVVAQIMNVRMGLKKSLVTYTGKLSTHSISHNGNGEYITSKRRSILSTNAPTYLVILILAWEIKNV